MSSALHGTRRTGIILLVIGACIGHFLPWPATISNISTPSFPTAQSLMKSPVIQQTLQGERSASEKCKDVVDRQRALVHEEFANAFEGIQKIALIGYPDHSNKGMSYLTSDQDSV